MTDRVEALTASERLIRALAWMSRPKFTSGALVCVVSPHGRIAMVRSRIRQQERWGLPGGFLKRSESALNAAAREVMEEVGVDLTDLRVVAEYRQPWARHFDSLVLASSVEENTKATGIEVSHIQWFDASEIDEVDLTRETRLAMDTYLRDILNPGDAQDTVIGRGAGGDTDDAQAEAQPSDPDDDHDGSDPGEAA